MSKKLNFDEAYNELQDILSKIQSDEVSVEELSKLVKRGAELIQYCKKRLRTIEGDINEAFKDED